MTVRTQSEEARTRARTVLVWAAFALAIAGCGSSAPRSTSSAASARASQPAVPPRSTRASPSASASGGWVVTALGDSVPAGSACRCTPFPNITAARLSVPLRAHVVAHDDAVPGYTTEDVIGQLNGDRQVIDDVRSSHLVEIEVGANDVSYSARCGTRVSCYSPAIPRVETELGKIVRRVHQLTAGHPTLVVLLDYWAAWLGGKYAAAKGEAYMDAATLVADEVNTVIRTVAAHTASAYVDLRAAFKGPDYRYDETHFLAPDGDHPNAAGHQRIATALLAVVSARLHLPPS